MMLKCDAQEQQEKVSRTSATVGGQGSVEKDQKAEKGDRGEQGSEEPSAQKEDSHINATERKDEDISEEEHMKVTEEGESVRESSRVLRGDDEETAMDHSDSLTSQTPQNNSVSVVTPEAAAADSSREPKPILGLVAASVPVLAPEVSLHSQRSGSQLDQLVGQEDCENMSTQSDNHSGNSINYYLLYSSLTV